MNSITTDHKSIRPALIMVLIFVLETIVAFHTLWRGFPASLFLMFLWFPLVALIRARTSRHSIYLALGIVSGEFIGYFWVVPPSLTGLLMYSHRYNVDTTLFLRFLCFLLFFFLFRELGAQSPVGTKEKTINIGASIGSILAGVALMCSFAFIQSRSTRIGEQAQERARGQLGPDFVDYKFFVRDIEQTFRSGQYMRVTVHLIAFQPALGSGAVEDVTETWKQPWTE